MNTQKSGNNSNLGNIIDRSITFSNRNKLSLSYNCLTSITSNGSVVVPKKGSTVISGSAAASTVVFRWF